MAQIESFSPAEWLGDPSDALARPTFLRPLHGQGAAAGGLLALALLGSPEGSGRALQRCATRAGIDLDAPLRVALVTCDPTPVHLDRLASRLVDLLAHDDGSPALVEVLGDDIVVLRADAEPGPTRERWRRVQRSLKRSGPSRIAVGGEGRWPEGLSRSLRQARWLAALQGEDSPLRPVADVVVFESSGLIGELVGATQGRELLAFARGVLAPLLNADRCGGELVDTLHIYLINGGSTTRAAELLHLHPSSVKYRLKVIRQLLGRERLDDADSRFELQLCLRLVMASRRLEPDPPVAVRS